MSSSRQALTAEQEPFLVVRSLATNYAGGFRIERHHHGWHQFLYAVTGAMTVVVEGSSWMIPTGRAVFIPAGCTHAIRMWGTVEMRTLYLSPGLTTFQHSECRVVQVGALLRELILRSVARMGLDSRDEHDAKVAGLLGDEIKAAMAAAATDWSLTLPMPSDEHALALARGIIEKPLAKENISDLARQHGIARRTLERRFRQQTGMSVGLWRQKARMLDSIRVLAEGKSVTGAALECGYLSVSAFIAAFKSTFGYTPGQL